MTINRSLVLTLLLWVGISPLSNNFVSAQSRPRPLQNWIATFGFGTMRHFIRKADGSVWSFLPGGALERLEGIDHVVALDGRSFCGIALKDDGTVWVWGDVSSGRLGNPSDRRMKSDKPVQVPHIRNAVAVSTTGGACYALLKDSTVVAWGSEGFVWWPRPTRFRGLAHVVAISGSIALLADGTVWAWGHNRRGALGNGGTEASKVPVQVKGLRSVKAISFHDNGGSALLADGSVWSWGNNWNGELGNGNNAFVEESSGLAVRVKNISKAVAISSFSGTCFALLADGTVMGWGDGRINALGTQGGEANGLPVKMHSLKNVVGIQSGIFHGFALLADGTLMGWGSYMAATGSYHQVKAPVVIAKLGAEAPR